MNNFERIANYNKFNTWDDMIEKAKEHAIELKIPNYIPLTFADELCATIKQMNFKLYIEQNKILLTRDKQSDIIDSNIKEELNNA